MFCLVTNSKKEGYKYLKTNPLLIDTIFSVLRYQCSILLPANNKVKWDDNEILSIELNKNENSKLFFIRYVIGRETLQVACRPLGG